MEAQDGTQAAQALVDATIRNANQLFGKRLTAAYALGSLAHGGFAKAVSDVDMALVIADPITDGDSETFDALNLRATESKMEFAERLSVFWGSPASLSSGESKAGRFPALDRLDLIRHGRLLHGQDVRAELTEPTRRQLVVEATAFALKVLAKPEVLAQIHDPMTLAAAGVRPLTKRVLFPVRFIYTAETGEVGRNEAAVAHYAQARQGQTALAELAQAGLSWRSHPPTPEQAFPFLQRGLRALYLDFLTDHIARMNEYGETALAGQLETWRAQLG